VIELSAKAWFVASIVPAVLNAVAAPIPFEPGFFAVPVSDAVSFSVLPRTHGFGSAEQVADVVSVGFSGVILKHSEVLELVVSGSNEPGMSPSPE
jgi:hypothetical protein